MHAGAQPSTPAPCSCALTPHPSLRSSSLPPRAPQNLIILLQVQEGTRALAPGFARMLLKQYFWAALPVTLWVAAFASNLGIALR